MKVNCLMLGEYSLSVCDGRWELCHNVCRKFPERSLSVLKISDYIQRCLPIWCYSIATL